MRSVAILDGVGVRCLRPRGPLELCTEFSTGLTSSNYKQKTKVRAWPVPAGDVGRKFHQIKMRLAYTSSQWLRWAFSGHSYHAEGLLARIRRPENLPFMGQLNRGSLKRHWGLRGDVSPEWSFVALAARFPCHGPALPASFPRQHDAWALLSYGRAGRSIAYEADGL